MKSSASKRYARALIELGVEAKACEKYGKELRTVLGVFKGSPEVTRVLLNPMYKLDERKGLIDSISRSLALSTHVARFLSVLVETRKIRLLDDIVEAYSRQEDEIAGRIRATIESPAALDPALMEELKKKISGSTGKEIVLSHQVNPKLLGGLVVRIENTILDGSLKTQLELMKEKIMEGVL